MLILAGKASNNSGVVDDGNFQRFFKVGGYFFGNFRDKASVIIGIQDIQPSSAFQSSPNTSP